MIIIKSGIRRYYFQSVSYRIFFLVFLSALLVGCDLENLLHSPLKWAVVDESKITAALTQIAYQQNPLPEATKSEQTLTLERRNLQRKISNLTTQVKELCMAGAEKKEALTKKKTSDTITIAQSAPVPLRFLRGRSIADAECNSVVAEDPLINDLIKKREEIDHYSKLKSDRNRKIQAAVKASVRQMVRQRLEREFDLVLTKRKDIVLHNHSETIVDVTDKMLAYIATSDVVVSID